MSGYPRNLSYLVKRMSGYSRNTFRLQTLNQTTATAGQIITVDLPSNALVDLSTFTMFFRGSTGTTGGFAGFPRNIETLIERLEVEINGQLVNTGCAFYNQLWEIIADTTIGEDCTRRRSILQNGADQAIPTANIATPGTQFCIQNWLGFLGSCKPNVLDTSLLGNVRVRITLSGGQVLIMNQGGAGPTYTLSDIFFSVDTLSIDDGMFYNMHQQFLSQGGVYEMPFNNYFSFTSTGGMSQATKFSLSTQSLNRVWATFIPGSAFRIGGQASSGFFDANINNSSFFTRLGNAGAITYGDATNNTPVTYALTGYQFNINNVYYPNYRPTAEQAYALMVNSYNLSQDTLGGGYSGLNSLNRWNQSYWVAAQEFEHGSDDFISGIDTRGNIAQCFWETQGTVAAGGNVGLGHGPGAQLVALVFAQTTSVLRVGAGRQIELVM